MILAAACWAPLARPALCQQPPPAATRGVDFSRDIRPVLARRCFKCHGPGRAEAGLRLHQSTSAIAPLDSGAQAIVPGKPEESELLARITAADPSERMPPDEPPLSAEVVQSIREWIAAGAVWPEHWSLGGLRRQKPHAVKRADWVRNPIDAFILSGLEQSGLEPAPPASKPALLRRAYYDLTGLPPAPRDVDAFLADESPEAFSRVVDRLLASPHYGERWGRHWLDLVRYADTNSFERDGVKPNAWRYRDYVIRSFNQDKPFDQFAREQLAGDELESVTPETVIATGYYRLGLWDDEPADPLLARFNELDDIVTITSQVFLGLTINCARCHDHKLDPIPQTDYYRMLAFFQDVTPYGPESHIQTDISPAELRAQHDQLAARLREAEAGLAAIEEKGIAAMPPDEQRQATSGQRKEFLKAKLEQYLSTDDAQRYRTLRALHDDLTATSLPPRELALSVNSSPRVPPDTFVLERGNPRAVGQAVEPGFPVVLGTLDPVIPPQPEAARSSGRRRVLADWIASGNPLTARVLANRIWQHHFGRGIVRTANNFGLQGEGPTHPELLEWLAVEMIERGWSMKQVHRLIMLSNTYHMSSNANAAAMAADPANNHFWRFNMRRLSAEEIRDTVVCITGRANSRMYGPGYFPEISAEVLAGQSQPGSGWGSTSREEQARRSIYIHVKRSLITPILASFDFPDTDSSCEARFATTLPTQALAMLNGSFMHSQAAELADRLRREAGADPRLQVELALKLALCRAPDRSAIDRGRALIADLRERGIEDNDSLTLFCLSILNLNELIYLD